MVSFVDPKSLMSFQQIQAKVEHQLYTNHQNQFLFQEHHTFYRQYMKLFHQPSNNQIVFPLVCNRQFLRQVYYMKNTHPIFLPKKTTTTELSFFISIFLLFQTYTKKTGPKKLNYKIFFECPLRISLQQHLLLLFQSLHRKASLKFCNAYFFNLVNYYFGTVKTKETSLHKPNLFGHYFFCKFFFYSSNN